MRGYATMIKVLFICHGNICRSTMAEYVMKDLVKKANLESSFYIDSAGTSNEEDGNPVHYGTQNKLREEGIPCGNHRARQMTKKDYEEFDYLIGMEQWNIRNINRIIRKDRSIRCICYWNIQERQETLQIRGTRGILM